MTRFITLSLFVLFISCNRETTPTNPEPQPSPLQTIAFGSCARQDSPQDIWTDIIANQPNLWIWLGDNIYGDTQDMQVMAQKYATTKSNPLYTQLRAATPVVGIWDDHDYGVNDGFKTYPKKVESKKLMLDFLDVPATAPVRSYEGAYQSYTFGPRDKRVKVLLLDARYFRDTLWRNAQRHYLPNPDGDMLGEAQWQWLERELTNSDAQIHLIGSGVQVLPEDHTYEKWANFPKARQRLFDLLAKTKPANAILLSGDRHIGEVSKMEVPGLGYPLYDITSSGLTHSYVTVGNEPNRHRVGNIVNEKHFGIMRIDWSGRTPRIKVELRGVGNGVYVEQTLN